MIINGTVNKPEPLEVGFLVEEQCFLNGCTMAMAPCLTAFQSDFTAFFTDFEVVETSDWRDGEDGIEG